MMLTILLLWMSAQSSAWITPNGECGQHADGSYTNCCGAMMRPSLNQEFAQAAHRAAGETDGKPPLNSLHCNRNMDTGEITPKECAEPTDVPAVQVKHQFLNHNCIDTMIIPRSMSLEQVKKLCTQTEIIHSCADKSRILLTSEDGKHHCVKF